MLKTRGGAQRPFEQCSEKLHYWYLMASLNRPTPSKWNFLSEKFVNCCVNFGPSTHSTKISPKIESKKGWNSGPLLQNLYHFLISIFNLPLIPWPLLWVGIFPWEGFRVSLPSQLGCGAPLQRAGVPGTCRGATEIVFPNKGSHPAPIVQFFKHCLNGPWPPHPPLPRFKHVCCKFFWTTFKKVRKRLSRQNSTK